MSSNAPESVPRNPAEPWSESTNGQAKNILLQQIDLEVALRLKASIAASAKIQWAQRMQHALVHRFVHYPNHEYSLHRSSLQDESLGILHAIERIQPLATAKPLLPQLESSTLSPQLDTSDSDENQILTSQHKTRPPTNGPIILDWEDPNLRPLYFLEEATLHQYPHVIVIACEICGRSSFSTIQAVLSHGRIVHGIYYRTHEELVRRCGKPIDHPNDIALVLKHGTETSSTILLGARSAVERGLAEGFESRTYTSAHSLGLHSGSAGLAEYLGRVPKIHSIRMFEPEGEIDIVSVDSHPRKVSFVPKKLPYITAHCVAHSDPEADQDEDEPQFDLRSEHLEPAVAADASRFHSKRRVIITDSSHLLANMNQASDDRRFQWMISVSAPSYSYHETTFVSKLTVSPAELIIGESHQAFDSCLELVAKEPPFCILGTAKEPFLALVQLDWVGGSSKPLVVTHYVRLDANKAYRTAVGDQQVLDVELDRDTPFRNEIRAPPLRFGKQVPLLEAVSDLSDIRVPAADTVNLLPALGEGAEVIQLDPVALQLLAKIPFTSHDLRARAVDPRVVSYALPRSGNEFLKLPYGRQRWHEWRHTITLKNLLKTHINKDRQLSQHLPQVESMRVATLYKWLLERKTFPQSSVKFPLSDITRIGERMTTWCSYCGLSIQEHAQREPTPYPISFASSTVPDQTSELGSVVFLPCPESRPEGTQSHLPAIDVQPWLSAIRSTPHTLYQPTTRSVFGTPHRDIIRFTDPALIELSCRITSSFELSGFEHLALESTATSFATGRGALSPSEREALVLPHALLGQSIRSLVKHLVTMSVGSAKHMAVHTRSRGPKDLNVEMDGDVTWEGNTLSSGAILGARQVLTTSHVLHALSNPSPRAAHLRACLGRLGVGTSGLRVPIGIKAEPRELALPPAASRVKLEDTDP